MSKFNTSRTGTATTNLAGGNAYKQTSKLEFVSTLLTTFVENSFYESESKITNRIKELVKSIPDKKFVAKTAIFARDKFNMRSASHIVAGEIANVAHGETWLKSFYNQIIVRPDDILEILSYLKANNIKLPNAMKKGFAKSLENFNDYQLGKYKKTAKQISLVDAVNLTHPKSNEHLSKLMKGQLEPPETWEVLITETKGDENLKKEAWKKLILENKLGFMALIRNLNNILKYCGDDQEIINLVCNQLTIEDKILNSRVLPFRIYTALEQLDNNFSKELYNKTDFGKIMNSLSLALDIRLKNVPEFDGTNLVVVDQSGSMEGKPSSIASIFASILVKKNFNNHLMVFSNDAEYKYCNTVDSTYTIAKNFKYSDGGTNFSSIFVKANQAYDRIIILSDMQGWINHIYIKQDISNYKIRNNAHNTKLYCWDLQNSGTMQFPENNVFCISGWSEKVFDLIKVLEEDKNALISEIEKIEI
jgi:hypothetical protein